MRRLAMLNICTLFALLVAQGCGDAGPTEPTEPASPVMAGTVIDWDVGTPIAGAMVRIGDAAVTTGADGRFKLADLTPGVATLRCAAPGYVDFEADITVAPGTVFRAITLRRIEVFELGDFALYTPSNYAGIQGILLALGGPDTRAFATGAQFGEPIAEVESSLQALSEGFRYMAVTRGLAILGTSLAAMTDGPESDQVILDAVRAAADTIGWPGLSTAPMLVYGMSGGGPEASGFTARHPERVVGLFLKSPLGVATLTSGVPLRVPTFVVLAELDAFVDNAALTVAFEANRRAGALWALANESGVPHHSLSLAQRRLTLVWIGNVMDVRMPVYPSEQLRDLVETDGWLGNPVSGDVSPWANYSEDRETASWFPTRAAAEWWRTFVDIEH
jgi:Carboxypeptidase regulatory-like domain